MTARNRRWVGLLPVLVALVPLAGCVAGPGYGAMSFGGYGAPYAGGDDGNAVGIMPGFGYGMPYTGPAAGWGGYGGWGGDGGWGDDD